MKNSYKYANIDFTGKRYGKLTVLEKARRGRSWWKCQCDCGKIVEVQSYRLFEYKSCGCLEKENRNSIGKRFQTHGLSNTRIYSIWCGMKDKCNNPNAEHYARYGGRGIKICEEWNNDFSAFYDWSMSNGYANTLSIDRIDVNGNYDPSNCRWIEMKYQFRNKENTVYVLTKNGKMTVPDFCELYNIYDLKYVGRKVKKGQTGEEILFDWNMLKHTPPEYMTLKEATEYYGVSSVSIHHWHWSGKLKGIVSGQRLYILRGQTVERRADRDNMGRFLPGNNK